MGGGGKPEPTPPNPNASVGTAVHAATAQLPFSSAGQTSSQYNQGDPYGSLQYTQTGTTPQGTPIWSANTQFSPVEQGLFNTYTGTQGAAGQAGAATLGFGNYGTTDPRAFVGNTTSGTTGDLLNRYEKSVQPFFDTQYNQLYNQLVNQGLTPNPGGVNSGVGNPAYDNAMRQLQTNQANAVLGASAQFEPQAFNQANQLYGLPMTAAQQLAQWGVPQGPNSMFTSALPQFGTPSVTQALDPAVRAQEAQYEAQQAQYNAQQQAMSGLFGVGGNILGDIALGAMMG